MLVSIILFFASFIFSIFFVTSMILNGLDATCLLSMLCTMVTFLVGTILFYQKTNKFPLNDISEYNATNFKQFLIKNDDCFMIQFVKKDGFWICENHQQIIKLNLFGYLFQQSYLISFVIRNLRYPLISNKLPYKYLFKNTFFIKENMTVKLVMIDESKTTEKIIVKDGISKYGFLAKHITLAPFYLFTLSNESYQTIRSVKSYIDEKRYKNFTLKMSVKS